MNLCSTGGYSKYWREILKGLGVVFLLLLLMMWLSGVFVRKVHPGAAAEKKKTENLKTWRVQKTSYPLLIEQTGTVRGQTEARVSSRVMAQVKEILVREGQDVTGGSGTVSPTLLARLDDRDAQARLRQAESQLSASEKGVETARSKLLAAKAQASSLRANSEKASLDFKRFEALSEQNAATRQQLDHTRAQRDSAGAQLQAASQEVQAAQSEIERAEAMRDAARGTLAEAQASLAFTQVYAPFSGKLVKKMVDTGTMASPGEPLFLIETDRKPELHASVSESLLPLLKTGQEFEVLIDALHRPFMGVLSEIVPQSDPATRTVLVKIGLPADPQLVNGLFGRLRIPQGEYKTLAVPAESVREAGQLYLVDVIDADGAPQRRFVTIGPRHDSLVEVLSGLRENEEVVLP
jgi:multidrug resistance efflux pump